MSQLHAESASSGDRRRHRRRVVPQAERAVTVWPVTREPSNWRSDYLRAGNFGYPQSTLLPNAMSIPRWGLIAALTWIEMSSAPVSQGVFRGEVHTIPIYATVRGRDGRLVSRLTRDDFRVLVDGQPVELTLFSNDVQPITVALLIDAGMGPRLSRAIEASHDFIDALLPADRATVGTFGQRWAVSPFITSDHAVLRRVVNEEVWPVWPAGSGAPWPAIDGAVSALRGEKGLRAIVVLSSGWEGGRVDTLRAHAQQEGVMIYGILFEGTTPDLLSKSPCAGTVRCTSPEGTQTAGLGNFSPPGTVLNPLAELTGGGHFTIKDRDDLATTMTAVAEELRHQYVLGFVPRALDGRAHEIRVQAVRAGLTIRARTSYIASVVR